MTNRALELYERARPLESLESSIFRTAQRASLKQPPLLRLKAVSNQEGSLEFEYQVEAGRHLEIQEVGALGGFALAAALTLRALVTRRTGHILGALQASSVAIAFGGREAPRLWRKATSSGNPKSVLLGLRGSRLYFKVQEEEVWVDLAPVTGLTMRSFRYHWENAPPTSNFGQIEMQDGRILTVSESEDSVSIRRLIHQISKAIPVELSFQNIDLYKEKERVRWELGPRLVEPALN